LKPEIPAYQRRELQIKTGLLLLPRSLAIFVPLVVSAGYGKAAQPLSASTAAAAQPDQHTLPVAADWQHDFCLTSTTFENDQQIPATIVFNGKLGSVSTGGNESSELSWTPAVCGTGSYAVDCLTSRQTSPTGVCSTSRPRPPSFLEVPPSQDFPPTGAALDRAMIGRMLESASITSLFSCTDANSCS
jgi:hypothetical protein